MIDLENPERIIRRATGKIYDRIKAFGQEGNMDGAHLVMKPDGVNLLTSRDQAMIEEHVANTNPDILFFGPIYKSFLDPGGKTAEAVCGEIVRFLDYIRVEYDCALWLEHHAPLGEQNRRDLRPFGSAVWSRWSEFGIALTPDITDPSLIQFNHYRGQREKREWPLLTKRGATWPFEVVEWAETDEDAQIAQAPQRTDEEMNEALADGLFDDEVSPW
jgi:replicative DNA helicase